MTEDPNIATLRAGRTPDSWSEEYTAKFDAALAELEFRVRPLEPGELAGAVKLTREFAATLDEDDEGYIALGRVARAAELWLRRQNGEDI